MSNLSWIIEILNDGTVIELASNIMMGPPGPQGPQGPQGAASTDAFLIANRLSELSSDQAKIDARQNLGLQVIDAGTFF